MNNYFRIGRGKTTTFLFFDDSTIENTRAVWAELARMLAKDAFLQIGVWRELPYEGAWTRRASIISGESMRFERGARRSASSPVVS